MHSYYIAILQYSHQPQYLAMYSSYHTKLSKSKANAYNYANNIAMHQTLKIVKILFSEVYIPTQHVIYNYDLHCGVSLHEYINNTVYQESFVKENFCNMSIVTAFARKRSRI